LKDGLRFLSPSRRIQSNRQHLDELARRTSSGGSHRLALERSRLDGLSDRLESLNPVHILNRGYAIITRQTDGTLVHKVGQARGKIQIRVSDGEFDAQVLDRKP
jgi:exodeoxyribonuclease VII large subunit